MGMTPEIYLESLVVPNADDCAERQGDIRRAFNAAVAASHFADHFFAYSKRHDPDAVARFSTIGPFIEHLSRETGGAFQDIRSIANAFKHLYTDDGAGSTFCTVSSAGSIDAVEIADDEHLQSISERYVNEAPGNGTRLAVVFTRKDGTKAEFRPSLEKVITHFWTLVYGA